MALWPSGSGIVHISEVTIRRPRLVLGWVTVRHTVLLCNQAPRAPIAMGQGDTFPIFLPGYSIRNVPPVIWGIKSSHVVFVYWFHGIHQNTYFTLMLTKKLQLLGEPLPGLCPWTPLWDFSPQTPCYSAVSPHYGAHTMQALKPMQPPILSGRGNEHRPICSSKNIHCYWQNHRQS